MSSNVFPFGINLSLINRKMSHGAKSVEYGGCGDNRRVVSGQKYTCSEKKHVKIRHVNEILVE
jgi:hypothetical protein